MFAECLAVGLACGDQRQLTGSGSTLEALCNDALYKSTYFTFFTLCFSLVKCVTLYIVMCNVGPPVWLQTADEDIYEPLGTAQSLPLPQDMALCEDSSTRDIGDWGELLVKNYLEAVMVSCLVTCYL